MVSTASSSETTRRRRFQGHVQDRGDEPVADALDLVQAGLVAEQRRRRSVGSTATIRRAGPVLLEEPADARSVPPLPTPATKASTSPSICAQISWRSPGSGIGVARVLELLRNEDLRIGRGISREPLDARPGCSPRGREDQFAPERPDDLLALLAHVLGHDDDDAVALLHADQGDADAGVARGRLDDGRCRA